MQQSKGTNNLSEIEKTCNNADLLANSFERGLKEFDLSHINKILNKAKTKGISCSIAFRPLFVLPFIGMLNVWCLMKSGYAAMSASKKDVFYTFLNNPLIDWRRIVYLFACQYLRIVKNKSLGDRTGEVTFMVLDDTLLEKTGKAMEFIGKVFDHSTHSYLLGMKALVLGLWDGTSFLPLDFSIHNEPGNKGLRGLSKDQLAAQFSKQRADGSPGRLRADEVSACKTTTGLAMIKAAIAKKIIPHYVLADSWFISDGFLKGIKMIAAKAKKTIGVIGLMKSNRKVAVNGKLVLASQLPAMHASKAKACRKHKCNYLVFDVIYKENALRLYFVKMNGQQNWKMLVSTDQQLPFVKAMDYYQVRWSIEVFFKDAKQNLHLGKCQSTDFDAQVASISIAFTNYMVLSLTKRFESYETIGEMFRAFKDTMLQQNIMQRVWKMIVGLLASIIAEIGAEMDAIIVKIINSDCFMKDLNNIFHFLMLEEKQENMC